MTQHPDFLGQVPGDSPASTYQARLEQRRQLAGTLQRQNLLLGYLRLLWALALVILLWYVFGRHTVHWPWLLLPCLGFGVTARRHTRVLAAALGAKRAVAWYELGLARLEDRWSGLQPRKTPAAANESLYAADLDLFGPGSLFELLCTTRTSLGESTLADWLLQPASRAGVLARQTAIREFRDRLDLRESMASASGPASFSLDPQALAEWGETAASPIPRLFRWLGPVMTLVVLAAAGWWAAGHSPALFAAALLVNGTLTFSLQSRLKAIFEKAEQAALPLQLLAEVFAILEREEFEAPLLRSSQDLLRANDITASKAVRRLAGLAGAMEQRANFIARLLDFGALYSLQLALVVQNWRQVNGKQLRSWFHALGEIEALLSFSAYHFEHPNDPFPGITTDTVLQARGLGHPLLPQAQCVENDVSLDTSTQLLIVSGSNMSGKSTLLRATGVACVMAMAGAPVRAHALQLGPLRVAASIQVQDSLQGGRSRFYAEILRLRAVCELARTEPPVLFLLDELLSGTNSQDRLAGATGVLKMLVEAGALGILSTHDLALTQLGADLQTKMRNAHFEDRIAGGGLSFDYKLREGIITRSNGLDLMRLIGLNV